MPVIECTEIESLALNSEERACSTIRRALSDRKKRLGENYTSAVNLFEDRAILRKQHRLKVIAASRVLPTGERAELPEDYFFFRDPTRDRLILAWGDVFDEDDSGHLTLRPYHPLPRWVPEEERDALLLALRPGDEQSPSRFADIDVS